MKRNGRRSGQRFGNGADGKKGEAWVKMAIDQAPVLPENNVYLPSYMWLHTRKQCSRQTGAFFVSQTGGCGSLPEKNISARLIFSGIAFWATHHLSRPFVFKHCAFRGGGGISGRLQNDAFGEFFIVPSRREKIGIIYKRSKKRHECTCSGRIVQKKCRMKKAGDVLCAGKFGLSRVYWKSRPFLLR